jgi:hypothetical protein
MEIIEIPAQHHVGVKALWVSQNVCEQQAVNVGMLLAIFGSPWERLDCGEASSFNLL